MSEQPTPSNQLDSKIKSIYIELPDYTFNHSANSGKYDYYIGRQRALDRLKMLLQNNSACESGTYLVAGYRGMGKTSLVHRAIKAIKKPKEIKENEETTKTKENNNYLQVNISLSQDDIRDFDVLKLMASQLSLEWLKILDFPKLAEEIEQAPQRVSIEEITQRLEYLSDRINAVVKIQDFGDHQDYISINQAATRLNNAYKESYQTRNGHQQEFIRGEYLSKEVERELIYILDLISELRKNELYKDKIPHIIFVLDELDKIEPNYFYQHDYNQGNVPSQEELDHIFGSNRVRRRQEVISKLLANLKSFLNTAKAKFIFIGGREMYDSSLADIADRDSFYSSIFHDIIYIESFFKDKVPPSRSGLTRLTEAYLCKILIPKTYIGNYQSKDNPHQETTYYAQVEREKHPNPDEPYLDEKYYTLAVYYHFLIDLMTPGEEKAYKEAKIQSVSAEEQRAIYKLIFFLQNFVLFLAYRSNGTPKKIVSILESYILNTFEKSLKSKEYLLIPTSAYPVNNVHKDDENKQLYLKFTFSEQYEIGLTANIYRPYVIIHSRYLKSLGDKLLYSSAYIIDYLLKFHTNAFSWRNLELLPEIILVNKDANLRYFISDILEFLSGMYIRETTTGMFQYKFYSKASHEIKFLTKISETASAAFNFTLDESQHIIRYYRQKLSQLRQAHPNYTHEFIHSISFIESILGDLYYFDKEYDEAIVYYADSIQVLRRLVQQKPHKMTKHQIILYVKNKLHLGLCLEKIKAYDSAYSIYRGLILNTPRVLERSMEGLLTNVELKAGNGPALEEEWDKPIRRMQLFLKPHIALLDLIEKQRMDGITYANLDRNYKEVYDFLVETEALQLKAPVSIGQSETPAVQKKMDTRRVAVLLSDYYSNVGSMLFYKNRNFPELQQFLLNLNLINTEDKNLYSFIRSFQQDQMLSHFNPSWSGFTYYYLALKELVSSYNSQIPKEFKVDSTSNQPSPFENVIVQAIELLLPKCQGIVSKTLLFLFGNLFTRLGDTVLSCFSGKVLKDYPLKESVLALFADDKFDEVHNSREAILDEIISHLNELTKLQSKKQSVSLLSKYCNINTVFLFYRVSSLFYHQASKTYSYAFQYKKLLFVFKDYLQYSPNNGTSLISTSDGNAVTLKRVKEICENIAERIFSANTWMADVSNRPQVLKYREIFRLPQNEYEKEESRLIYLNLSTSPEIRETVALVEEIKLKLRFRNYRKDALTFEAFQEYAKNQLFSFTSPYDLINNRYSRVHELKLQSEINYAKLRAIGTATFKPQDLLKSTILINLRMCKMLVSNVEKGPAKAWGKYKDEAKKLRLILLSKNFNEIAEAYFDSLVPDDIPQVKKAELSTIYIERYEEVKNLVKVEDDLEKYFPELFLTPEIVKKMLNQEVRKLIQDSIFALFEIVRTLNVYGISYISNHSFLANIHSKLADWCSISLNYDLVLELAQQNGWETDGVNLRGELKRSQGEEDVHYFEPNYHRELAIQHYSSAIQTHNGGNAYKKLNQAMSFLEDDFNDNLSHFSAASERFRINIGEVQEQLRDLKNKIRHSNLYAYDSYVRGGEQGWEGKLD